MADNTTGGPASRRHIFEFSIRDRGFTGRQWEYRTRAPGNMVSDMAAIDRQHLVLIERDGGLGLTALDRKVNLIDLRRTDADGYVRSTLLVDLAAIADPALVSVPPLHGGDVRLGDPCGVVCESIEAIHPVGRDRLLLGCDNNLPNTSRNPGRADDNEFIVVEVPALREPGGAGRRPARRRRRRVSARRKPRPAGDLRRETCGIRTERDADGGGGAVFVAQKAPLPATAPEGPAPSRPAAPAPADPGRPGASPRHPSRPGDRYAAATALGKAPRQDYASVVTDQERQPVSPVYEFIPNLGRLRDAVLFGDVWEGTDLTKRDRSLVTVAVLAALYRTDELKGHMRRALDNGVTEEELKGLITHIAFYAGWPTAVNAGRVALDVFGPTDPKERSE